MECPICFELVNEDSFITFMPCEHSVHVKCINEWKNISSDNSLLFKCIECNKYRDYEFVLNPIANKDIIDTNTLPSEINTEAHQPLEIHSLSVPNNTPVNTPVNTPINNMNDIERHQSERIFNLSHYINRCFRSFLRIS